MKTQCPVCLEPFNADTAVPKCLDCGHTMCRDCINLAAEKAENYNCPVCRKPIGNKSADEMPTNYALIVEDSDNKFSQDPNLLSLVETFQYPEWRPALSKQRKNRFDMICSQHNQPMTKTCSCGQAVCGSCLMSDKHRGHGAQSLDPMFFVPISVFTKSKLRVFAREILKCVEEGNRLIRKAGGVLSEIRKRNEETLYCRNAINTKGLIPDFLAVWELLHALNDADTKSLYQAEASIEKLVEQCKGKVVSHLKEMERRCPGNDRVTTRENASWLVKNIGELKADLRIISDIKKKTTFVRASDSLLPRGFWESEIDLSLKVFHTPKIYEKSDLVLCKSKGLSKTTSVNICWNYQVAHLLQEALLYTFCFTTETFDKKELMFESTSQEYLNLTKIAFVAPNNDDKTIYLIGGYNTLLKKEIASCFIIDTDRVKRIDSLNTPKASATGLFLSNYIYAIGGEYAVEGIHKPLSEIERYCLPLNVWVTLKVSLVAPRYSARAVRISDSEVLICGGFGLDGKFVNQMDVVAFFEDDEGASKALPSLLKCSEKITQFHAYNYKGTLCTISGFPINVVEEEKSPIIGADHVFILQHYVLDGKMIHEKILGRAKVGICEVMPEHDGKVYDFWVEAGEKKTGANWGKPRVFSIEDGQEKPPNDFKELISIISSTQEC